MSFNTPMTSPIRAHGHDFSIEPAADPRAIDWVLRGRLAAKRAIDILGAALGLLALAPLLIGVAVAVRLTSRGPALFRQTRLGRHGRPFQIYKFRTMVPDAESRLSQLEHLNESEGGVLFKLKQDPRVTPLGRFLRRTSLDELPQLLNVLSGEMSLVGPRPLQIRDCELMRQADHASFRRRLEVTPGLTGYWQVNGRSEVGFAQMLEMDLRYIDEWSLRLDLMLIVRTALGLFNGRGAC